MTKLDELVTQINREHVYIQTHNFPDPDAIASAFGLQELLKLRGDRKYQQKDRAWKAYDTPFGDHTDRSRYIHYGHTGIQYVIYSGI